MFRVSRRPARRALLSALLLLAAAVVPFGAGTAAAAGPKVSLRCAFSADRKAVSCWTWGSQFMSSEQVSITYRVTYITQPKVNGKRPQRLLRTSVRTTATGSFVKPAVVTFPVSAPHNSFALHVTAIGAQKDKGTTSFAAIGR